jgi:hypothetical protein
MHTFIHFVLNKRAKCVRFQIKLIQFVKYCLSGICICYIYMKKPES